MQKKVEKPFLHLTYYISGPNVNNIRCLVLSGGYLSLTAVPYAMTSAAPCITEEEP
jgi:hypothetical protein